jgi:hypothetical protein
MSVPRVVRIRRSDSFSRGYQEKLRGRLNFFVRNTTVEETRQITIKYGVTYKFRRGRV